MVLPNVGCSRRLARRRGGNTGSFASIAVDFFAKIPAPGRKFLSRSRLKRRHIKYLVTFPYQMRRSGAASLKNRAIARARPGGSGVPPALLDL
jgi:hypothetical protein